MKRTLKQLRREKRTLRVKKYFNLVGQLCELVLSEAPADKLWYMRSQCAYMRESLWPERPKFPQELLRGYNWDGLDGLPLFKEVERRV